MLYYCLTIFSLASLVQQEVIQSKEAPRPGFAVAHVPHSDDGIPRTLVLEGTLSNDEATRFWSLTYLFRYSMTKDDIDWLSKSIMRFGILGPDRLSERVAIYSESEVAVYDTFDRISAYLIERESPLLVTWMIEGLSWNIGLVKDSAARHLRVFVATHARGITPEQIQALCEDVPKILSLETQGSLKSVAATERQGVAPYAYNMWKKWAASLTSDDYEAIASQAKKIAVSHGSVSSALGKASK